MNEWANFFVAVAGAGAALCGLIFVGVSLSLTKILAIPKLPNRALGALTVLLTVLGTAVLGLVPAQPATLYGIELLCIGLVVWSIMMVLDVKLFRKTAAEYKSHALLNILFTQLSLLPYIIAGCMMLANGLNGIYWLVPGIIFCFIKAIVDAWVLLVEIHR